MSLHWSSLSADSDCWHIVNLDKSNRVLFHFAIVCGQTDHLSNWVEYWNIGIWTSTHFNRHCKSIDCTVGLVSTRCCASVCVCVCGKLLRVCYLLTSGKLSWFSKRHVVPPVVLLQRIHVDPRQSISFYKLVVCGRNHINWGWGSLQSAEEANVLRQNARTCLGLHALAAS